MSERSKSRSSSSQRSKHTSEKRSKLDLDQFGYEDEPKKVKGKREKSAKVNKLAKKVEQSLEDIEDGEDIPESVFKKAFAELRKTLGTENTDISVDIASSAFQRSSLLMLTDLVPLAEEAYRKTKKESAAYALTALLNQIREVNNDLRVVEDVESKALNLRKVIDSSFLGVAQLILQEKYELQNKINALTNDSRIRKAVRSEIDSMVNSMAEGLQQHSNLCSDRIRAYLLGQSDYMNPYKEETPIKKKKRRRKEEE